MVCRPYDEHKDQADVKRKGVATIKLQIRLDQHRNNHEDKIEYGEQTKDKYEKVCSLGRDASQLRLAACATITTAPMITTRSVGIRMS